MTECTPRPTPQTGFSLLELLVTMAIVSILAGIGFVNIPRERMQVQEAARIMASDLRRARSEAIRLNTNVAFALNPSNGSYRLYIDTNRDGTGDIDGIDVVTQPQVFSRNLKSEFPRVNLSSVAQQDDAGQTVWFDSRGLPRTKTGGPASGSMTVNLGSDSYSLVLRLETQGRVQVVSQ